MLRRNIRHSCYLTPLVKSAKHRQDLFSGPSADSLNSEFARTLKVRESISKYKFKALKVLENCSGAGKSVNFNANSIV